MTKDKLKEIIEEAFHYYDELWPAPGFTYR